MKISELNRTHPLNLLAAECLHGYPWSSASELAILVLIDAYWDEISTSRVLNQRGGPSTRRARAALKLLARIEPEAAMDFLTRIGGKPALDLKSLGEMDGEGIAHEALCVVASQLMLGVRFPAKQRPIPQG